MLQPALRLMGAVLLGALTAGSFAVTGSLARLEAGIRLNATALDRTVDAQRAVLRQNEMLREMVQTTGRLGDGLGQVLTTSEAILAQVDAVGEANRATLHLNRSLEAANAGSAQELARVVEALRQMNRSAAVIANQMEALQRVAAADVDLLEALAANTARMNARTPGW